MADPLLESAVFPPMVCQMIAVGESTGALDAMLEKIADFYDEEVDQAVDNMTQLIEPIMLVFLGVTIGGLVVAMYLPIFKMAGAISEAAGAYCALTLPLPNQAWHGPPERSGGLRRYESAVLKRTAAAKCRK